MPYERLPARLRQLIPSERGQQIFRQTVNSQLDNGRSEAVAMASAWSALRRAGFRRDDATGKYERVEKSSTTALRNKLDEWNEKYADKHGKVTMGMLRDVYDRGVGAYRTNPESVRPNVNSPERWAMARVHSFMSAARGAKKINHDQDIHDKIKKSNPTTSSVHVPSANWKTEKDKDSFKPPAGAKAAARRALRWREKHGDEVKGGTRVGWTRATQLANGESLSRETVARMASFFARHRGNERVDPKHKDEPWRDNGHVAWLIWGSDAADKWSRRIMDNLEKRQAKADTFDTEEAARERSDEMGLDGAIHSHGDTYMPGKDHDEYLAAVRVLQKSTASVIIDRDMEHCDVNKSVEQAQVLKMDDEQRIVYGWASVVTEDGEPVVDTQGDVITPEEMEKMANDFMQDVRKAKAMHQGGQIGEVIHSMPLTNELMKAFDIYSDREGWLVAFKIYDDDAWDKVRKGEFQALSIGGKAGSREAIE